MTTEEALEKARKLVGVQHKGSTIVVTRELIQRFCRAVGEDNPLHTSEEAAREAGFPGLVAPPTMFMSLGWVTFPQVGVEGGRWRLIAGLSLQALSPVVAGDTLVASVSLKDAYSKTGRSGTTVFMVWETTFVNQKGVRVLNARNSTAMNMDGQA